jgi:hypothetical protein
MLFDPAVVWQPQHRPFLHDGEPARHLHRDLRDDNQRLIAFPFCSAGYLVHLGRGTLAEVHARDDASNDFAGWADTHHDHHFAGRADGPDLVGAFEDRYRHEVRDDHDTTLIDALVARAR